MAWLVTGGAGYIGSHVVAGLRNDGQDVVVVDDLSTGRRNRVPLDVPFVQASVSDRGVMQETMRARGVTGVVHLAAKKAVDESVARPLHYYEENVGGLLRLLEAVVAADVHSFVFSSSAAVYGTPDMDRVDEGSPTRPESPYGETKLVGEWLVRDAGRAHGVRWCALRYFNVAGVGAPELVDDGAHNLVPKVFAAVEAGQPAEVYGTDYPTRDGSCIRDYIHVSDLAAAHISAGRALASGLEPGLVNIGRGEGLTVFEVLDAVGRAVGHTVNWIAAPRRPGDPAQVVATADRALDVLGWTAELGIDDMVGSAWRARKAGGAATGPPARAAVT